MVQWLGLRAFTVEVWGSTKIPQASPQSGPKEKKKKVFKYLSLVLAHELSFIPSIEPFLHDILI